MTKQEAAIREMVGDAIPILLPGEYYKDEVALYHFCTPDGYHFCVDSTDFYKTFDNMAIRVWISSKNAVSILPKPPGFMCKDKDIKPTDWLLIDSIWQKE